MTANTSAIWQHVAHTTDQLTSSSFYTGAIPKKNFLLTKNIEYVSENKSQRMGQQAEKDKMERVTGLGRRTRE